MPFPVMNHKRLSGPSVAVLQLQFCWATPLKPSWESKQLVYQLMCGLIERKIEFCRLHPDDADTGC